MSKPKPKKLTYNEIGNYVVNVEHKFTNALNSIGQTIADYIEFKGESKEFMKFLKEKYEEKAETKEEESKHNTEKT